MNYKLIYFLGIGGIGMSAIARYFKAKGFDVAGYDRTSTILTRELEAEGIKINYVDELEAIPVQFTEPSTLIVYTPAIPADNKQYRFFANNGFCMMKRAAILGEITRRERGLCIAGTHGKTTTSTMTAHILKQSHVDCNAFLGGISKNYTSNLLLSDNSDLVVIEADEFDRSFHHLSPYMAVITSTDADHLDIYGTHEVYLESFAHFTSLIVDGGVLFVKKGIQLETRISDKVTLYSYSGTEEADFYADNVRLGEGRLVFDFVTPDERIVDVELGVPVMINVENAVAAMSVAYLNGVTADELRASMTSFAGIRRRFDFHFRTDALTVIDDYAHHPMELEASLKSVNALYADKKIVVVFQPHLYTRTRDFYHEFATALSHAEQVVLVEIYPARELPIEGVTSQMIFDKVTSPVKHLTTKSDLINTLKNIEFDVLLTVGAGDIDTYIPQIISQFKL
jgi:UDP-N-acetylmuramate--alanine ligase